MAQNVKYGLYQILQEDKRKGNLVRIFPAYGSHIYLSYFSSSLDADIYNLLYTDILIRDHSINIDSEIKLSLVTDKQLNNGRYSSNSASPRINKPQKSNAFFIKPIMSSADISLQGNQYSKNELSVRITGSITGDDILIEYMKRLLLTIRSYNESTIDSKWEEALKIFIMHGVWRSKITPSSSLYDQLKCRVKEMLNRKRQNIAFAKGSEQKSDTNKKPQAICSLPNEQLEYLLKRSLRNKSFEMCSGILFSDSNEGILVDLTKKRLKTSAMEKHKDVIQV